MALEKLYTARDELEAHYLKGLLEAEGIAAVVLGEALRTGRGDLPLTTDTLPAVWTDSRDRDAALALVAEFTMKRTADEEADRLLQWTCADCGEMIEGQFTDCWNCGAPRSLA